MTQDELIDNTTQEKRMDAEDVFQFKCSPGVPCFTQCCQDVTIVLTPYDVARLKNALRLSSEEFLDKYTLIIPKKKHLIPLVVLQMNKEDKKCPLVNENGCTVYEDRPWPCRMFPLDMNDDGTFRLISDSSRCLGLLEKDHSKIGEWLFDQGIVPYDEMNRLFSQITAPLSAQELDIENPSIVKMVFMALYNLDKFKEFVFNSSFMDRFDIEDILVEKIKRSDTELLKFAFDWIKFGIFGEKLFWVKENPPSTEK